MISVVGGGPAGARAAELLAKHDKVVIFEEHKDIGLPVQCTGITTSHLAELVSIQKEFLLNKITRIRVCSPNNDFVDFDLRKPNLVLDRAEFDKFMVNKALDSGAELLTNHKFLGSRQDKKIIAEFDGGKKVTTDILIGADGPFSRVAKSNNMLGSRSYVLGVQARVKIEKDPLQVDVYLNKEYMGWVVPESGTESRVGIVAYANHDSNFRSFLNKTSGNSKVIDRQSGFIPVFNPKIETQKKNVYLVGDAATQVKATTYGGIVPGLIAADQLHKAYAENTSYDKAWRREIGSELKGSLLIRKRINKFKNRDYDKLIEIVKTEDVKNIIEEHDREFPSRLALKLLFKEPRLLRFLFI